MLNYDVGWRGFACPAEGPNERLFAQLIEARAQLTAQRYLRCFGAALDDAGPGVADVIRAAARTFESARAVEWTQLARATRFRASEAAALVVQLAAAGQRGDWRMKLEAPTQLRWNTSLLPRASTVEVRWHADAPSLRCDDKLIEPAACERLDTVAELAVVPARGLAPGMRDTTCLWEVELFESISPATRATFAALVDQLAARTPSYSSWIRRIVRELVPVTPPKGFYTSGGVGHGLVYLSFNEQLAQLGEALVHESSHQYFELVTAIAPVDDGSDPTLYYSPLKQTGRPLDRILYTFHAIGNMLLYFRDCGEDTYVARTESHVRDQAKQLAIPLRSSGALTALGRDLFEPLWERLF
jgi:hypothetical protein